MIKRFPWIFASTLAGTLGCNSDSIGIPHPDQSLFRVQTQLRAVTLTTHDPYRTVQLSTVAYRGNGEVIPDLVATFSASDETLMVTEDGLVTGLLPTTDSYVVAQVQYHGVTRADTTWISVIDTETPSPLSVFSIQVSPIITPGIPTSIDISAYDGNDADLASHIPVSFTISDPAAASVSRLRTLTGNVPERSVTVYATTTVFGVTLTDSAQVNIGYPDMVVVAAMRRKMPTGDTILVFEPNNINIREGGVVLFCNCGAGALANTQPLDVVFAQPDAAHEGPRPYRPGAGNIAPFIGAGASSFIEAIRARTFPVAGTYAFRSERYGTTGAIVVR